MMMVRGGGSGKRFVEVEVLIPWRSRPSMASYTWGAVPHTSLNGSTCTMAAQASKFHELNYSGMTYSRVYSPGLSSRPCTEVVRAVPPVVGTCS